MSILNITHEELRRRLYGLDYLNEDQRRALYDLILHMNGNSDWFPDAFRRNLKELREKGMFSEFEYGKILREFFPGHAW